MTQVTRRILNRVDFGTESFWCRTISGTERIPAQRGLQKRVDSGTERYLGTESLREVSGIGMTSLQDGSGTELFPEQSGLWNVEDFRTNSTVQR